MGKRRYSHYESSNKQLKVQTEEWKSFCFMPGKNKNVSCIKLLMKGLLFKNELFSLLLFFFTLFPLKINTTQKKAIIILYPGDGLDIKH